VKVYWTDQAKTRLQLIHDYIAEYDAAAAKQVIQRMVLRSQTISTMHHAGRMVPEYQSEDLREILVRPYRIIYRILTDRIDVITVMHYRQLIPSDLKKPG